MDLQLQQRKKEFFVKQDSGSNQYFRVQAIVENQTLPSYDRLLAQIDNDYLVLSSTKKNLTDIVSVSMNGFQHVLRVSKAHQVAYQHGNQLLLGNEVYNIPTGFTLSQTIFGEELTSYCAYDNQVLLAGSSAQKISIFMLHGGKYEEFRQIKVNPVFGNDPVISLNRINEKQVLVIMGRPRINIRMISIDPYNHHWNAVDS